MPGGHHAIGARHLYPVLHYRCGSGSWRIWRLPPYTGLARYGRLCQGDLWRRDGNRCGGEAAHQYLATIDTATFALHAVVCRHGRDSDGE
jgi:hypothetical protein